VILTELTTRLMAIEEDGRAAAHACIVIHRVGYGPERYEVGKVYLDVEGCTIVETGNICSHPAPAAPIEKVKTNGR
jgi:hypothetical protein